MMEDKTGIMSSFAFPKEPPKFIRHIGEHKWHSALMYINQLPLNERKKETMIYTHCSMYSGTPLSKDCDSEESRLPRWDYCIKYNDKNIPIKVTYHYLESGEREEYFEEFFI